MRNGLCLALASGMLLATTLRRNAGRSRPSATVHVRPLERNSLRVPRARNDRADPRRIRRRGGSAVSYAGMGADDSRLPDAAGPAAKWAGQPRLRVGRRLLDRRRLPALGDAGQPDAAAGHVRAGLVHGRRTGRPGQSGHHHPFRRPPGQRRPAFRLSRRGRFLVQRPPGRLLRRRSRLGRGGRLLLPLPRPTGLRQPRQRSERVRLPAVLQHGHRPAGQRGRPQSRRRHHRPGRGQDRYSIQRRGGEPPT